MNCAEWEERLALYVGGDLSLAESAAVERHLGECAGCQLFSSGLKEGQEWVREAHREPLAAAHFGAVRARVLAEIAGGRRPFWRRGWAYGLAAVAVAALALMAVRESVRVDRRESPAAAVTGMAVARVPEASVPVAKKDADEGVRSTPAGPSNSRGPRSIRRRASPKVVTGEPVIVRVVTGDLDVVIYWIADTRGE